MTGAGIEKGDGVEQAARVEAIPRAIRKRDLQRLKARILVVDDEPSVAQTPLTGSRQWNFLRQASSLIWSSPI
jgi:hypothetical protein